MNLLKQLQLDNVQHMIVKSKEMIDIEENLEDSYCVCIPRKLGHRYARYYEIKSLLDHEKVYTKNLTPEEIEVFNSEIDINYTCEMGNIEEGIFEYNKKKVKSNY